MRGPLATVDLLIEVSSERLVLVRRKNPPPGWALPGGFIEAGESAEEAAAREAEEETGLRVELRSQFHAYSAPGRDPRHPTLTVVFLASATGMPVGGDDAAEAQAFGPHEIPGNLAFDHHRILVDYLHYRRTGERPGIECESRGLLAEPERSTLLAIARNALTGQVLGNRPEAPPIVGRALGEPGAVFVSLHLDGVLRGCIGHMAFDRPLHRAVHDMAIAAGFEDPRFSPLRASELERLEIEISVLSRPRPLSIDEIVAGWHGVSLTLSGKKAVFLPQVAREEGWSRRTLLTQLAQKAGLPPDAWTDARAEIEAFTAEVFGAR